VNTPESGTTSRAASGDAARGTAGTLGVAFPPAGRRYTPMQLDFLAGIAEAANEHGYDIVLSPGVAADDSWFRGLLRDSRVDGVIVMEIHLDDDRVERLTGTGFPFVTIGRTGRPEATWWVDLDHATLAANCVRHLFDLGHRRIAFVNRPEEFVRSGYESATRGEEGFRAAMREAGLEGRAYPCGDDAAAGTACVERVLRDDPATTGIVTMNEASLGGLYRGLTRVGRTVPRDFSVVGVTAGRWAEQLTPQLTAAEVPAREEAAIAVEMLVERLRSPGSTPRHVLHKPLISLRGSTAPAR
jgi:DNA-binding LacI/PurR family transcriptional regulator